MKVVRVGDGLNDVPVFQVVGYSVALNASFDVVRKNASYQIETDNLLDLYSHIH
jgi:hydroxymethylpyrimidine pyrophosphatase-like HAD family hydrolase